MKEWIEDKAIETINRLSDNMTEAAIVYQSHEDKIKNIILSIIVPNLSAITTTKPSPIISDNTPVEQKDIIVGVIGTRLKPTVDEQVAVPLPKVLSEISHSFNEYLRSVSLARAVKGEDLVMRCVDIILVSQYVRLAYWKLEIFIFDREGITYLIIPPEKVGYYSENYPEVKQVKEDDLSLSLMREKINEWYEYSKSSTT